MIPVIGFAGYARSGKDSAAQPLIDRGWHRFAFADAVRDCVAALNPLVEDDCRVQDFLDCGGWEVAKQNVEVRRLLQHMGTEAGRKVLGENTWTRPLVELVAESTVPVVVTDVRFPNEVETIDRLGGEVVRVTRPGIEAVNAHTSETALDAWPLVEIVNDGSLEDLHAKVCELVDDYLG